MTATELVVALARAHGLLDLADTEDTVVLRGPNRERARRGRRAHHQRGSRLPAPGRAGEHDVDFPLARWLY